MTKTGVIRCLLSVVLIVYLVMALLISNDMAARDMCRGFQIEVMQNGASRNFVSKSEVERLLAEWHLDNTELPASHVPIHTIESKLNAIDNIEHAVVERTAANKIRISVTPMIPVARIFDNMGHSYYINREGKRLTANARFRLDVPVITGHFDAEHQPRMLLPLLSRISNDSAWNALVAQIMVEPRHHDVILVPMIRGHVINLGDTSDIDNKLSRVMTMYRRVLPLKGWTYYDTLNVKWRGQVVATRRVKSIPEPLIRFDQEGDETENEDVNSMLTSVSTDTVALPPKHKPSGTPAPKAQP